MVRVTIKNLPLIWTFKKKHIKVSRRIFSGDFSFEPADLNKHSNSRKWNTPIGCGTQEFVKDSLARMIGAPANPYVCVLYVGVAIAHAHPKFVLRFSSGDVIDGCRRKFRALDVAVKSFEHHSLQSDAHATARSQLANVMRQPPSGETADHFPLIFLTHHLRKGHLLQEFLGHIVELLPRHGDGIAADLESKGVRSSAESVFKTLP